MIRLINRQTDEKFADRKKDPQVKVQNMDKLQLTGRALGRVFNFKIGCMDNMHLLPSVAIQPNLELKTQPKQLLGSLPLVILLPVQTDRQTLRRLD